MEVSKVSRSEVLGMVAAAILVVALLFLDWYDLGSTPQREMGNPDEFICGTNEFSCTGFDTFPILRWLLIAAAAAPFILAWIVIRGHKLSWAPGELTMVVGFTAFVLIAYNGLIDAPGTGSEEIAVSKDWGYYVALIAAAGIAIAGIGRSMEEQTQVRKTPGTV